MSRAKVPIKKIQNNYTRKVTFLKRRNGLIKKAYELSVLCDIEVALIMFSPTGQLSHFSNHRRIEDVLMRYLRHEEQEKTPAEIQKDRRDGIHNVIIPNKENLISVLENLKAQADVVTQGSSNNQASSTSNLSEISGDSTIKDLNEEVMKSHARYEELKDTLWLLYGDIQNLHETHEELDERETRLMEILTRVRERKKYLMTNSSKLAASVPLPSMLPQNSTLLPTITQGLVQIMQPHQEGTSSQVQQKSILLQQTKASNEKIILQPQFEGYLGMKMEGSLSSENKVSEYQNQPSYFSNGVVPITYESTQVNPRKQTWKTIRSTSTSTPSLPTIPQFSVFQQSFEDGDNQFSMSTVDVKTPWPETKPF